MNTQVFLEFPPHFKPLLEVAGVFCECERHLLYLQRHSSKIEGLRWVVPGGKLEQGETPQEAAQRELLEETGIECLLADLQLMPSLYIRRPEVDFVFHLFFLALAEKPHLRLAADEAVDARWVTYSQAQELPLISGGREVLDYFSQWNS